MLVEKGHADINVVDSSGKSALYYAIECNDLEVAEYLTNKGAVQPEAKANVSRSYSTKG